MFLLVGILGFIPGVTAGFGNLMVAGHDSDAMLLGLFQYPFCTTSSTLPSGRQVSCSQGRRERLVHSWSGGGAIYAVLWVYGLVVPHDSAANIVPLNTADNWLHFVLAVGMIGLGILLSRNRATVATGRV